MMWTSSMMYNQSIRYCYTSATFYLSDSLCRMNWKWLLLLQTDNKRYRETEKFLGTTRSWKQTIFLSLFNQKPSLWWIHAFLDRSIQARKIVECCWKSSFIEFRRNNNEQQTSYIYLSVHNFISNQHCRHE